MQNCLLITCWSASVDLGWAASCVLPPLGLVSWWHGDTNVMDIVGGNNGSINGSSIASGQVGPAFVFDGPKRIQIADSPSLDPTNALALEGGFYASSLPTVDIVSIVTKQRITNDKDWIFVLTEFYISPYCLLKNADTKPTR